MSSRPGPLIYVIGLFLDSVAVISASWQTQSPPFFIYPVSPDPEFVNVLEGPGIDSNRQPIFGMAV
jgi:hypothetical protein